MAGKRLDALWPRTFRTSDGQERTKFERVGDAWLRDDGGVDVSLWIVPLPNAEGRVRVICREADLERRQGQGQGGFGGQHRDQMRGQRPQYNRGQGPGDAPPDDDIPF